MTAPIARLRHRLVLERPDYVSDEGGGASVAWLQVAELWAAIDPLSGGERVAAQRLSGHLSHRVTLRYRPDVTPEKRFRLGTRLFVIDAVIDVGERKAWLKCLCREEDL